MGILNITEDSFSDGGKFLSENSIRQKISQLVTEGADLLDIGACSTRPGSTPPPATLEGERLTLGISIAREMYKDLWISADTYRSGVAELALEAGANMINDVSGGSMDKEMIPFIANQGVPYVLGHIQGTPEDMQLNPQYKDVVLEVNTFFQSMISVLEGLNHRQIILDPGFGFGKTILHNFELLKSLPAFSTLGYPVCCGLSKKSMIGRITGAPPSLLVNGTTVLNTLALAGNASILRVHHPKEAKEAVSLFLNTQYPGHGII